MNGHRIGLPLLPGPARCAETDPDQWFPEKGERSPDAILVCRACDPDVRTACLDFALTHREQGIWGGTTETQRRLLMRARRMPA